MQFSKTAEPALISMFNAATKDGVSLIFGSGYRSESLQKQFYDSYVAKDGKEAADKYSAVPGTSEHQTGLAFDATSASGKCHLEICWAETPEGQWVKNNSYRYGFIVRYLDGKESVTTYQYEPWHLRYVGVELATELHKTGQTMEEFFGPN
jgi:D-alanyl-D-alanine carboxypeptidase